MGRRRRSICAIVDWPAQSRSCSLGQLIAGQGYVSLAWDAILRLDSDVSVAVLDCCVQQHITNHTKRNVQMIIKLSPIHPGQRYARRRSRPCTPERLFEKLFPGALGATQRV